MNFRGERFHIDLPSDDENIGDDGVPHDTAAPSVNFSLVKDIQERPPSSARPPTAPNAKATPNGFPVHKKRTGVSRFKQAKSGEQYAHSQHPEPATAPSEASVNDRSDSIFQGRERRDIDNENKQRLAQMSEAAIAEERQELLAGLNPSLIERLLRRANIDTDSGAEDFPQQHAESEKEGSEPSGKTSKRVTFEASSRLDQSYSKSPPYQDHSDSKGKDNEDAVEEPISQSTIDINPSTTSDASTQPPLIHFPQAPAPPDLDPSSATFLTDLHTKYFPNLPADPSKLAWMAPTDSLAEDSPYDPSLPSLPPSALRFSFTGALLPPVTALSIPVTAGLHHHGDAPASAGYTIPELAHLSRSAFPAQRCVAFQTIGRVLYRLGRGEFGANGEEGGQLGMGLWKCVDEGRVLETLEWEAGRAGGHVSAKAYATEALWLWRKGGGKKWKAS